MTAVPVPPIPTAQAVDGARLLGELRAAFTRYVVLPSPQAADAVTLWTAATPRPAGLGARPPPGRRLPLEALRQEPPAGCGRRDLPRPPHHHQRHHRRRGPLHRRTTRPPCWSMRPTPSGAPSKQADANEDLRGLLNAGHQRNRPMLRWDVTSRTAEQLDTFAMALLAAIGELPDTIMDRAVVVRMRRRAPGEQVDPYRTRRDAPPLHDLRDRLAAWARAASARAPARHPGDAAGGPGRRHLGTPDRHRRPRRR